MWDTQQPPPEACTLRKYGYPPDKQQKATDTVIQQAELLGEKLAG